MCYGGYTAPSYYHTEDDEITVDYFEFKRLWPSDTWPEQAAGFYKAYRKGSRLYGQFYHRDGVDPWGAQLFYGSSVHIDHWGAGTRCYHEYVNVSFNLLTMACKHCGVSQ